MLEILGKTFYSVEDYLNWLTEGRVGEPVEPFSDLESLIEGGKAVWETQSVNPPNGLVITESCFCQFVGDDPAITEDIYCPMHVYLNEEDYTQSMERYYV